MKWITVFADASFRDGCAGYAFFVRDEKRIVKRAYTYVPAPCPSSVTAELTAMVHALAYAITLFEHSPGDRISAQTDCTYVIDRFELEDRDVTRNLMHDIRSLGISVHWKHIKAHTGASDRRSYVNRWCDRAAKTMMRRQHNQGA